MGFPGSILLTQGDEFKTYPTKRLPLGTRGYTRDGRVFHFAQNGGIALARGILVQAAAVILGRDTHLVSTAGYTTNSTKIVLHPSTKGYFSTDNAYAEGYLWVSDSTGSTGQGQLVQIQSVSKSTSTGTKVTLHLKQEARFTKVSSTKQEMGVTPNLYGRLVVMPTSATACPVGVTPRSVSANCFFWLQTWGASCVKTAAALLAVAGVIPSTVTAGAVTKLTTMSTGAAKNIGRPTIGHVLEVGAANEYALINLMLAP